MMLKKEYEHFERCSNMKKAIREGEVINFEKGVALGG
jgi:hypothetical protein